jgi:hypothetical protein
MKSIPELESAVVEAAVCERRAKYGDTLEAHVKATNVLGRAIDALVTARAEVEAEEAIVRWGHQFFFNGEPWFVWTESFLGNMNGPETTVHACLYRRLRDGSIVDVQVGARVWPP